MSSSLVARAKAKGLKVSSQIPKWRSNSARKTYNGDLQRNAIIIADRQMTYSIAQSCVTNGSFLALSFSQEQLEACKQQVALRFGGNAAPLAITQTAVNEDEKFGRRDAGEAECIVCLCCWRGVRLRLGG
ncbi:hypothetical protein ONS95_003941 [Cadophora gregata]|uniref:uncharacterized protein n=1 Tax=Cadophora gregata TaxID=51156 RepID=UPI0026DD23F9|nr:uncharacterized protein ONS95_003941 [Cadophora gregata]KAK0107239.1 hypothetical protein ONS95_003941 [Cadophora gregata]KAK0116923.1 hypothetical protein ONS96_012768 [Cadophora gregata f. sp. sojae]